MGIMLMLIAAKVWPQSVAPKAPINSCSPTAIVLYALSFVNVLENTKSFQIKMKLIDATVMVVLMVSGETIRKNT
ncbi:hypothetical protein D3C81_1985810 [compost metagenome]